MNNTKLKELILVGTVIDEDLNNRYQEQLKKMQIESTDAIRWFVTEIACDRMHLEDVKK